MYNSARVKREVGKSTSRIADMFIYICIVIFFFKKCETLVAVSKYQNY